MKVVLQVLTVMSLISLTKGSGCNPFLYDNITVNETTVADTELLLMEMEAGEGLEIEYQSYRIANSKLRDYYRGALRLIPTYNNNPDRCQAQAGVTHCKLVLAKPLDAEVIFQLAGNNSKALQAKFTLSCTIPRSRKSRTVTLMVCPVDEFDPEFSDTLRNVSVTEMTRINTVITDLNGSVYDRDRFTGGGVQNITLENGTDWIRLNGTKVVLTKEIRFEELVQSRQTRLWFQLSAQDSEGRVGKGLMIVHIEDVDNHPPYFSSLGCQRLQPQNCSHPFYTADVPDDFTGDVGSIRPAQILAEDGDIMLNATIRYSFLENDYADYVQIDGQIGTVRVVAALTKFRNQNFTVVATEDTNKTHHSAAILLVHVATVPVTKDHSSLLTAIVVPVVFIIVVVVAAVVYFSQRWMKKKRRREEEPRPIPTEETLELTSSQSRLNAISKATEASTTEGVSGATTSVN